MPASQSTKDHKDAAHHHISRRLMRDGNPLLQIWFGNFFEPFYSDRDFVAKSIRKIKDLGFNTINLDSKAWADFFARYRGEPASPYVAMQEFMLERAKTIGMHHTFLALYLSGDNLYPTIRDVPAVRGEDAIGVDGKSLETYKYWSPKAQASMLQHVRGLLSFYREGGVEFAGDGPSYVIQSFFEPIPKPSFDPEGRDHYLHWLQRHYAGRDREFQARYGVDLQSAAKLQPEQYWLRPRELSWAGNAIPTADDFRRKSHDLHLWLDNQTYLAEVCVNFFISMKQGLRQIDSRLYLEPVLHQWGYLCNPPGFASWDTGRRALDIYKISPHIDSTMYLAAPLNSEGYPDPTVLDAEYAITRTANEGREFSVGLYLGRHVYADVYRSVSPAEAIASAVASGAAGYHVYGYSGLDDGGVFCMLDETFLDSVSRGNRWANQVIPLLAHPRRREIALLFPAAMCLYEPASIEGGAAHRMDTLGWFQQLSDLAYHVDLLHPDQINRGLLRDYKALVLPHNSCYDLSPDLEMERAIADWVAAGGVILHGPGESIAKNQFAITERQVPFDCIAWSPRLIPHGWSTVAFDGCQPIASYDRNGGTAIGHRPLGKGHVYSFGFEYGYAYSRRSMPAVPPSYGRQEAHPVVLLPVTPAEDILRRHLTPAWKGAKGLHIAQFGDAVICVNHRPDPIPINQFNPKDPIWQIAPTDGRLPAHSAVFFRVARD